MEKVDYLKYCILYKGQKSLEDNPLKKSDDEFKWYMWRHEYNAVRLAKEHHFTDDEELENFMKDEIMSAIAELPFERSVVREKFRSAFMKMIGNEDCIVIGRCGNFIFKDRKDLVTVFLHGSLSDRIANAAEEENLSMSQAEEFVHTTDDCRVSYHSFYTGLTWGYAPEYDLCIDTCRVGTERTAAIIEDYISKL